MMKIELIKRDITKMRTDVIVNAADTSLLGGRGVDGLIHRAGDKQILEDCIKIREKQGGCEVGEAVMTRAGNLACQAIIHTMDPVYNKEELKKEEQLSTCYMNSIR